MYSSIVNRPRVTLLKSILSAAVIALSACGGGGGGGDGDSSTTGVRVVHGSIDAVPVEVVTTGVAPAVVTRGTFGLPSSYGRVPGGDQTLLLTRATAPADIVSRFTPVIDENKRYSILLFGDNESFGLRTLFVEDKLPEPRGEGPYVRVASATTGAASVRVTIGSTAFNVPFGSFSEYVEVASGPSRVSATRAVDGLGLGTLTSDFQPGIAYTIVVGGEAEYFVKTYVLTDG